MRRSLLVVLAVLAVPAGDTYAQDPLTLVDAIRTARAANPSARAAQAAEAGATARVDQATAAWWPRVDFAEGLQRGNLPVFVFGSLLSQRRFTEANFAVEALNHPNPLSNHRASVSIQQPLFSSDVLSARRAALLDRSLAATRRRAVDHDLAFDATKAYADALVAQSGHRAAEAAVKTAEEDLRRTEDRRATGLATDADVLSISVHLARMRARAIEAQSQARIAMASLNRVMGRPLDREYTLAPVAPASSAPTVVTELERAALEARPEAHRAALEERRATIERDAARMAFLPQLGWQGGYEWNGQSFSDRAGGWLLGLELRVNVFRGLGDRARLAEAAHAIEGARAEREATEAAIRLDVRASVLRLESARARVEVGRASAAQARASQRIIRDRYENGLAGVGDVLRAAEALLEAETEQTTAEADVMTSAAALDRAVGR